MKKNFYLQHPLMAMSDPRMRRLVKEEKMKGLGAYWFIVEKLALHPEWYAKPEDLKPFCGKEISYCYLKKVISDFQLFIFDVEGYFIPAPLNPARKEVEIVGETMPNSIENETKSDEKGIKKSQKHEEKSEKQAKTAPKCSKNEAKTLEKSPQNTSETGAKTLNYTILAKNTPNTYKENIKDIITTATEKKEKEKKADVDADGNIYSIQPTKPIGSWQTWVDNLPQNSQWLEIACMRSGYSALLMRHFQQAVEIFREHIMAYDKGDSLLTMNDVHRYFVNFVSPGSRTSKALHEKLLACETQAHPAASDPYRYEQRHNGKRTYMGCIIPDDAPPRPDSIATWDPEMQCWITLPPSATRSQNHATPF